MKKTIISLLEVITLVLKKENVKVLTDFQLAGLLLSLDSGEYRDLFNFNIENSIPIEQTYGRLKEDLLSVKLLKVIKDFSHDAVFLVLSDEPPSVEEVVCAVDPFCYLSHFTALGYYGLTNRVIDTVYYSSPDPAVWIKKAKVLNENLSGNYKGLPRIRRLQPVKNKILKRRINCYNSKNIGGFKKVEKSMLRVSSIGRTFFDALQNPDFCGGIHHVLEIFQKNVKDYKSVVIETVDRHGTAIDKVRTGYILEEVCQIKDERIEQWVRFAQRGGSRKLDISAPYSPHYSEKWCLSLNI